MKDADTIKKERDMLLNILSLVSGPALANALEEAGYDVIITVPLLMSVGADLSFYNPNFSMEYK